MKIRAPARCRTRSSNAFLGGTIAASLLLLALIPYSALAQVVISEVMYDAPGTEGSGDHDWVEVFNVGSSAVDLSTYRFFEANTNHTLKVIEGSAMLPSGGYAVIANIPDTFKADWPSYGGALFDSSFNLNSTGELIGIRTGELTDTDPPFTYVPEDSATNGGNSLHRTAIAGPTFSALPPTPGTGTLSALSRDQGTDADAGADTGVAATSTVQTQTSQTASKSGPPVSSYVPPPLPQLFADAGDDRTVIVGADTQFNARAYNRSQDIVGKVRFMWNFGDGAVAEGQSVLHHFEYPGRYAVSLDIAHDKSAASDRIIVTAEPARLSFSAPGDGSVVVGNKAGHDLDFSNWLIRNVDRSFMLPEHTVVLSGETLRVSQKTLGFFAGAQTELAYPNGTTALSAGASSPPEPPEAASAPIPPSSALPAASVPRAPLSKAPKGPVLAASPDPAEDAEDAEEATEEPALSVSKSRAQEAAAGALPSSPLWWFVLIGGAMLASIVLIAARIVRRKEWVIQEF